MSHSDIAAVLRIAATQHGAVARRQVVGAGISDRVLGRMRASGIIVPSHRGVDVVAGERDWLRDQSAAHLAAGHGALASHRAAAHLLELEGFDRVGPEITIPHRRRARLHGVTVHRSTDLAGERRVRCSGLVTTNAARTLIDLGALVSEAQLEVALEDALRRRLTTVDVIRQSIGRLGRPGRSGVPQLRDLLIVRGDLDDLSDTGFEVLLLRALRAYGLRRPVTQFELYDDEGEFVMRFDGAYVPEKVGLEADSKLWHATDERFEQDREKRARAAALGWNVLAITNRQVRSRPAWVGQTVARALAHAASRIP